MTVAVATTVLEALGIMKTFPGTVALDGVDFTLERGRVHALVGENGAGKSTLVKILAGVEQPTAGRLRIDGHDVRLESARDAGDRGIHLIHQELQLFPDLSVAENLFVGRERLTRWGTVDATAQESAARATLARLGQRIDPRARLGTLPLGQQQIVEIARALVHDVRILMMDEPTSALTAAEIPILFGLIRELAVRGVAIVYISHRLEELLRIAETVTVLRDGRVVGHAATSAIGLPWIVERMTGRASPERPRATSPAGAATVLSVRDLRLAPRPGRSAIDGVSFELKAGEVVGLYGVMGAGRTELFESLLGVHPDATGEVRLGSDRLESLEVSERVEAGLAMVPEDRQTAGLVDTMTVRENMTLSSLARLARHGYLAPAAEAKPAAELTGALRIKAQGPHAPIGTLSGGNQQKVVIARGVMSRPRVLLLDEPTRGVDVGAKAEILETMRTLAAEGLGVMFASSELDEVRAGATRILVMARGRITGTFDAADATDDMLASAASATERDGMSVLFRLRALVALVVLVLVFSVLSSEFLTAGNLGILIKHVAINAILAIGMTFVILSGGIDLSVGSIAGLCGMVAGALLSEGLVLRPAGSIIYLHTWMVIVIALGAGMALGAVNGWLVARLRVAPFIATLGVLYMARGTAMLMSDGATFPNLGGSPALGNTGFPALGTAAILGVPAPIWLMGILAAAGVFVATRTPFGRQVYAIGGNERAALLAGVRVPSVKFGVYVISGFCAGLVGLIIAAQLGAAHPATGETFELNAIAAVVLGGTSLMGGRGGIGGTLVGAFVIGVLADGLVLLGVSEFWQMVIKGLVIVLAVILDQFQKRSSS